MNRMFLLLVLAAVSGRSLYAEEVIWFVNDFPPFTVLEGSEKGSGVVQKLMDLLAGELPEITFVPTLANISRVTEAFKEGRNSVYGTYRRTSEREAYALYSRPYLIYQSAGIMVHESFRKFWAPYLQTDGFHLPKALEGDTFRIAGINGVSLGPWIDGPLETAGEGKIMKITLTPENILDPRMSLLSMNRITAVPGYEESLRLDVKKAGLALEGFLFFPIAGAPAYQQMSLAVPKSDWGRGFLEKINPLLIKMRPRLAEEYAKWLSPASRERYGKQVF